MILDQYVVNEHTLSLVPAKQIEYDTIVYERDHTFYVRKTPLQIIKDSCLANWHDYDGRRKGVMHKRNYRRKVPIPIDEERSIIAFPTHSTQDFDCHWIISLHILDIKPTPNANQAIIVFKNRLQLTLDVSAFILKTQFEKALACMDYKALLVP